MRPGERARLTDAECPSPGGVAVAASAPSSHTTGPRISVIIPTHQRPELVTQAVECALAQTLREIEVIVVVDGADAGSLQMLAAISDPRLVVVPLDPRRRNAGARNAGISRARADWVAFLDDDDKWMPEKLERQLAVALASDAVYPIVSCRFEAVGNGSRFVWPTVFPQHGQPLSEYLFTRRGPAVGGAIQTSTMLVSRALFAQVTFDEELDRYVDLDWLLRAGNIASAELSYAGGKVLSSYSMDDTRKRISNQSGWRREVAWIKERRELVTARAYGGYLLTQASIRAEKARDKSAFLPLMREALRGGKVSPGEVLFHVANTFLPARLRRGLTSKTTVQRAH